MFASIRRLFGFGPGRASRVTGDASRACEALIRELGRERDYWRTVAEGLIQQRLSAAEPTAPAVFSRPSSVVGTPFAELFSAMASDRVGYPHADRPDGSD